MATRPPPLIRLAALVLVAATGCASTPEPPAAVVSPTGVTFEPGIPPAQTRFSQVAVVYISQGYPERALEQALQGIESNPYNPIHFFLAGLAHTRLGDFVAADSMFRRAQAIYPAYELQIEPERERAWAETFNAGLERHMNGDLEGTLELWRRAIQIYDLRPEAHRNLGTLLAELGEYEEAIGVFRAGIAGLERQPISRVLSPEEESAREAGLASMTENLIELLLLTERYDEAEEMLLERIRLQPDNVEHRTRLATALSGQGRNEEAAGIYASILESRALGPSDLFKVGVSLFRLQDYARASEAFRQLTEKQPESRDAWFNYANSLFASGDWERLRSAAARLVELDPLSENAALIAARAQLEAGDHQAALRSMERIDASPIHLADLRLRPSAAETRVEGQVVGNAAEPGDRIRLHFTFYDDDGPIGMETVVVEAPAPGEVRKFEVVFRDRASAYRYQVLP